MVKQVNIARKLDSSRQTVDSALPGPTQVNSTSRRSVPAAASTPSSSASRRARFLRPDSTGVVALWVPDQISSHYTHVARQLGRLVKQAHRELVITEIGVSPAQEAFSRVPVDVIFAVDARSRVEAHLRSANGPTPPIISMGADFSDETDSVQVDLASGTRELMHHLLALKLHRIAHATFVRKDRLRPGRRRLYRQAMRAAGLRPEFIYYPLTQDQRPVVRWLVKEHVLKHGCPDAIFCHSDDAALGVYRGLRDLKLRVPEQVVLAGCDGIHDTEYLECPLTTIAQPVVEMCEIAWRFFERRLANPHIKRQAAWLKAKLVVRESTRRRKS